MDIGIEIKVSPIVLKIVKGRPPSPKWSRWGPDVVEDCLGMRVGIHGLKTGELNTYKKELSKAKAVFLTVHDLGSNNWSMRRFASLPAMANIASRYRFTTYFYLLKRVQAGLCSSMWFCRASRWGPRTCIGEL